mmetsp:Transcript_45220/g.118694  ORF Transcript_45220/g.118694 Transcript_45220/m.118694 type:complete len:126 (+) Transcript_45220:55-432(+)
MSLKMTTQMEWQTYARYSKYHPDNLYKLPPLLPEPVKGPPPLTQLTEVDKRVHKAWGHTLCCEQSYGKTETTTRIKENVTPKVGQDWHKVIAFERGNANSKSAMYSGSMIEMSFNEVVEARGTKG